MMPHNDFYNYIIELETVFVNIFHILSTENGVDEKIKFHINNIPYSLHAHCLIINT